MNTECCVCYDTNNKFFKSSFCNHNTCVTCYKKLKNRICPICRKMLKKITINPKTNVFIKLGNYKITREVLVKHLTKFVFSKDYKIWLNSFINLRHKCEERVFNYHRLVNINVYPFNLKNDFPNYQFINEIDDKTLGVIIFFKTNDSKIKMNLIDHYLLRQI